MDNSHVCGFPTEVATILRNEKRRFEDILHRIETGQLTLSEANREIKNAERVLRCLRYSRAF